MWKALAPAARTPAPVATNAMLAAKSMKPPPHRTPLQNLRNKPEIRETTHWYLQLNDFKEHLERWIATKDYWKENVRNFMLNLLEQGLVERPITRDLSWGVPVPLADADDKVLYVWFEAPLAISPPLWNGQNDRPAGALERLLADPETRLVHFIGKDNIIFHALIWPAVLMGQTKAIACLMTSSNEFLNLEGQNFPPATTGLSADEIAAKFPLNTYRYYLACIAPEKGDSDFSFRDFQQKVNGELNNVLGNLANRVFTFSGKNFEGRIAHPQLSPAAKAVLDEAFSLVQPNRLRLPDYQVKANTRLVMEIARLGNRFFDERKPWAGIKTDPDAVKETLWTCLTLLRLVSVALFPIMPVSMDRLRDMMGLEPLQEWEQPDLSATTSCGKPVPLAKLDDATIEAEIALLHEKAAKAGKPNNAEPIKAQILREDFDRLTSVCHSPEAAPVPKTNKLLRLKVDLGSEQRELVAGIAEHYKAEDVAGKQVLMLVNLEPRSIRGIVSQGMVLAVNTPDALLLVHPAQACPPGSVVK